MDFISNEVREKFASYPLSVRPLLLNLRHIIITTAQDENLVGFHETLKWGQPSYLAQHASTIRLDWSEKQPDHYYLYFTCNTKLIATFKELYPNEFDYHGNRAIAFDISKKLASSKPLIHCLSMSFNYHKIKHLPLLGN